MNRQEWIAVHTVFSYVFIGFAFIHLLVFNWTTFFSYLKKKRKAGLQKKREVLWASLITFIIFFGTLFNIPPFKTVMDLGDYLSGLWERNEFNAPYPHTDRLTLNELSERIPLFYVDDAIKRLGRAGVIVEDPEQSLAEIGIHNSIPPVRVFELAGADSLLSLEPRTPAKLTLREASELMDLSMEEALYLLNQQGFAAAEDVLMLDLAKKYKTTPGKLILVLKAGKKDKD